MKSKYRCSFWLIVSLIAFGVYRNPLKAQEVLISDTEKVAPFIGIIGYRIEYKGKLPVSSKPYLPDSVTLFVGKNSLRYTYHGGTASQMQSDLLWDGDHQMFWLIDHKSKAVESPTELFVPLPYTSKKLTEKAVVAGKKVIAWNLIREKQIDKVWVNDSIWFGGQLVDSLKGQQPAFLASGLRSIPLLSTRTTIDGVITNLRAVTIKQDAGLDPKLFLLPENYIRRVFDPSEVRHPMFQK